jgi:glycosyltransferase involved in cell wall biosynthesis
VGGVQVVVRDLARWLGASARRVDFITAAALHQVRMKVSADAAGRLTFGCPMPVVVRQSLFLSVPVFLLYLPLVLLHLIPLIRRRRIDVINCHYLDPYFLDLVIAGRLTGVPVVISVHGADVDGVASSGQAARLAYKFIIRGASRIVACSEALAQQVVSLFPNATNKVTYVHNALDLGGHAKQNSDRTLPRRFILSVSRHVHKKGIDTLLRAFAMIANDYPDVSLILVGDGPLSAEYRALAIQLNIDRQAVFAGEVAHEEVSIFFERCAFFVLPSRAEPFGVVLLEAAQRRRGILATRVGGVPEIVSDGVSGMLVRPDDPQAMADCIRVLLNHPDMADHLGANAYRNLISRFLWADRIRDYLAIFDGEPGPSVRPSLGTLRLRPTPSIQHSRLRPPA